MKKILISLLFVISSLLLSACSNQDTSHFGKGVEVSFRQYKFNLDKEMTLEGVLSYNSSNALKYENSGSEDEYYLLDNVKGDSNLNNKSFDIFISLEPSLTLEDEEKEINDDINIKNVIKEYREINDIYWQYFSYMEHRDDVKEDFLTHVYYLEKEFKSGKYLIKVLILKADDESSNNVVKFEDELMKSISFVEE